MALAAYARNLYGPARFVDINVVTIVITASGRDTTRSSPETSVGAASGSGDYVCTMPSGQKQVLLGAECVNSNTDRCEITSLSSSAGVTTFTASKSDNADIASSEEMHITFLVFNQ